MKDTNTSDLEDPSTLKKNVFSNLFSKVIRNDATESSSQQATPAQPQENLGLLAKFTKRFKKNPATSSSAPEQPPGFFQRTQSQMEVASGFSQNWPYILGLSGAGIFFMILALFSLPFLLLSPHKFCLSFAMGSICFLAAIALLRDPMTFAFTLIRKDKLPYTLAYGMSLIGTFFFSLVAKSWLFSMIFTILQVIYAPNFVESTLTIS